jgi:putative two-component system response regulator
MARVLIVDDQAEIRTLLRRQLEANGHVTVAAANVAEARARLADDWFELVLCDINMPGESGIDFVRFALVEEPDLACVMVSGNDDLVLAERTLELGAFGYVVKPFRTSELSIAVANALRRRRLEIENREHREQLEQIVLERTTALRQAVARLEGKEQELQLSREETIHRLARAAEFRDQETGRHVERVSRYSALIAKRLGLEDERVELLRLAAPLHDIGKIAIPDRILLKPSSLTADERRVMETHAETGYHMLADSGQELLELAAVVALTHHERIDGEGYPRKLQGAAIPLPGRIVAVADVFDALTSDRVYRPALEIDETVRVLRAGRGTQFDETVLDVFLDSLPAALAIKEEWADDRVALPTVLRESLG